MIARARSPQVELGDRRTAARVALNRGGRQHLPVGPHRVAVRGGPRRREPAGATTRSAITSDRARRAHNGRALQPPLGFAEVGRGCDQESACRCARDGFRRATGRPLPSDREPAVRWHARAEAIHSAHHGGVPPPRSCRAPPASARHRGTVVERDHPQAAGEDLDLRLPLASVVPSDPRRAVADGERGPIDSWWMRRLSRRDPGHGATAFTAYSSRRRSTSSPAPASWDSELDPGRSVTPDSGQDREFSRMRPVSTPRLPVRSATRQPRSRSGSAVR